MKTIGRTQIKEPPETHEALIGSVAEKADTVVYVKTYNDFPA